MDSDRLQLLYLGASLVAVILTVGLGTYWLLTWVERRLAGSMADRCGWLVPAIIRSKWAQAKAWSKRHETVVLAAYFVAFGLLLLLFDDDEASRAIRANRELMRARDSVKTKARLESLDRRWKELQRDLSAAPTKLEDAVGEWHNSIGLRLCRCPPAVPTLSGSVRLPGTPLPAFWLGKYEVTQDEYQRVMGANPSHFSPNGEGKDAVATLVTSSFPVENASWHDAVQFCRELTNRDRAAGLLPDGWEYMLPTEAQWQYGCRAGTFTSTRDE